MTQFRTTALLLTLGLASACVPRQAAPPRVIAPPPPVVQAPRPLPAPAPPPPAAPNPNWADAPLSPGNWMYRGGAPGASALFGPAGAPTFVARCTGARQMLLIRTGAAGGSTLTFRTSSFDRTVNAALQQEGLTLALPAGDPLLDALIFSRGRFAVEAPGAFPLVVPTWPELARVVEDCRR